MNKRPIADKVVPIAGGAFLAMVVYNAFNPHVLPWGVIWSPLTILGAALFGSWVVVTIVTRHDKE